MPGRHPGTHLSLAASPAPGAQTPAPWLCRPLSTERPPGSCPPRCCREAGARQTARTLPSSPLRRARERWARLGREEGELRGWGRGQPREAGFGRPHIGSQRERPLGIWTRVQGKAATELGTGWSLGGGRLPGDAGGCHAGSRGSSGSLYWGEGLGLRLWGQALAEGPAAGAGSGGV